MLPDTKPTCKRVEAVSVLIAGIKEGKASYPHINGDQASVLVKMACSIQRICRWSAPGGGEAEKSSVAGSLYR